MPANPSPGAGPGAPAFPPATPPTAADDARPRFDGPTPTTAQVEARIATFLASPDANLAALLAIDMAHHGDRRWVPYMVDLLAVIGDDPANGQVMVALQALTGELVINDPQVARITFGSWMLRERPDPGPGYLAWKRTLFARFDPALAAHLAVVTSPTLMSELQWASAKPDGLVALDRPRREPMAGATWATPDELVFGVVVDGVAVAYPERLLARHEVADDVVGATPVVVAYSPLCHAVAAFAAGDQRFHATGLARDAAKLLVDDATGSLWGPLSGRALAGPAEGQVLAPVAVETRTWSDWLAAHPASEVVALPARGEIGGQAYDYLPGVAYAAYDAGSELAFPARNPPRGIAAKADVATLLGPDGGAFAVDAEALARRGPMVLAVSWGRVLAVPAPEGARFYAVDDDAVGPAGVSAVDLTGATTADGVRHALLAGGRATWFSWYAEHPATDWWPR